LNAWLAALEPTGRVRMEVRMPDNKIAVVANFTPKPGHETEVEKILRTMVAPTRAEPGCRRYDLYRNRGEGPLFTLFEIYDDAAAVEAHRATTHWKAYRAAITDHLGAPIHATLLDGVDVKG
jgi:quinol monooxygenase YgiN